jgi:NAD(P)-dependent dehydrogenase (short-subunit alcohol dehydrogenase family)
VRISRLSSPNSSTNSILPIVTGANRGIRLGIVECCLINGAAKVYSIDLAEPGEEVEAVSKRFPARIFAVTANVTEEASVTAAVDRIVAEAGGLHGMVVNAGRTNHKPALDFTQEEIEGLFAVNVREWHIPSEPDDAPYDKSTNSSWYSGN